jgi:hypothetical protein
MQASESALLRNNPDPTEGVGNPATEYAFD